MAINCISEEYVKSRINEKNSLSHPYLMPKRAKKISKVPHKAIKGQQQREHAVNRHWDTQGHFKIITQDKRSYTRIDLRDWFRLLYSNENGKLWDKLDSEKFEV